MFKKSHDGKFAKGKPLGTRQGSMKHDASTSAIKDRLHNDLNPSRSPVGRHDDCPQCRHRRFGDRLCQWRYDLRRAEVQWLSVSSTGQRRGTDIQPHSEPSGAVSRILRGQHAPHALRKVSRHQRQSGRAGRRNWSPTHSAASASTHWSTKTEL